VLNRFEIRAYRFIFDKTCIALEFTYPRTLQITDSFKKFCLNRRLGKISGKNQTQWVIGIQFRRHKN